MALGHGLNRPSGSETDPPAVLAWETEPLSQDVDIVGSTWNVSTTDNDTASVTVTPTSGLVATEAGGTATFTMVLTAQPTANVTIGQPTAKASRLVMPPHAGAAQILRETLGWMNADKAMQADRARLTKACCAPEKFVSLEGAPRPSQVNAPSCEVC